MNIIRNIKKNKEKQPTKVLTVYVMPEGNIKIEANTDMIPKSTSELCMLMGGINVAMAEVCKSKIIKING